MEVHYDDKYYGEKEDFYLPVYVKLNLSHNGTKMELVMSDLGGYHTDDIKDLVHSMKSCKKSAGIGGGGNSSWCLYSESNYIHLEFDISGMGDDASLRVKLLSEPFIPQFEELLKVYQCADQHVKYTPAVSHASQ